MLAQRFGRDAETDGFLAAYAVYLLLVLAAQAARTVVLPDLTRAAAAGTLAAELRGYLAASLALALPASVLVAVFAGPLADAITGALPAEAAQAAASALPWLVPAAFAQLLAAVAVSALAARDSYGVAALAYSLGALAGLVLFVALSADGVIALAWGVALNGLISVLVPLWVLARRGDLAPGAFAGRIGFRLARLAQGAAVPLALQALYLIALRLAADVGVGRVTSLSYAYLIASVLVATTASSLGLVSSAPLTRRGLDAERAAAHVVNTAWLSFALIAAGAGVFALAGETIAGLALGDAFSGEAGRELGRLIVALAPWMLASVGLTVTFPLLYVMGRRGVLVPLALGLPILQLPLAWAGRELFGLAGIALALAVTTLVALGVLLASLSPYTLTLAAAGLGRLALVETALAALSFGALSLVLGGIPAALAGLALYTLLLAAVRPRGLREAWAYVRALG